MAAVTGGAGDAYGHGEDRFRSPSAQSRRSQQDVRNSQEKPRTPQLPPIPRPPSREEITAAQKHLVLLKAKFPQRRRTRSVEPGGGGAGVRGHSMPPRQPRDAGDHPPAERAAAPERRGGDGRRAASQAPLSSRGSRQASESPSRQRGSSRPPREAADNAWSEQHGSPRAGGGGVMNSPMAQGRAPAASGPPDTYGAPPPEEAPSGDMQKCLDCGRSFNPDALERHAKICKKVFMQKRKAFNSAANRLGEFENAQELVEKAKQVEAEVTQKKKAAERGESDSKPGKPMPAWKKKSLEFRAAMLAQKGAGGDEEAEQQAKDLQKELGDAAVNAPPDPDKSSCPHCGRTFNKDAAERHIAICLKMFGGKPGGGRLMKGAGTNCNTKTNPKDDIPAPNPKAKPRAKPGAAPGAAPGAPRPAAKAGAPAAAEPAAAQRDRSRGPPPQPRAGRAGAPPRP